MTGVSNAPSRLGATEVESNPSKVVVVKDLSQSKYDRTFRICNEGHSLGNALSSVIRTQNGVKFCGYAIPHPTNDFFELKIIMDPEKGITSKEALVKGLQDLKESTSLMKSKFSEAMAEAQMQVDPER